MSLTLVTNPIFEKKETYTSDEKRNAFSEFYKLANKIHHHNQLGVAKKKKTDLHWKDEMCAIINPKDFNKFADAVAFVCGSSLEEVEKITYKKVIVYASGYWNNIGA